ncbi:hypothetical protein ACLOJK_030135 [Asimina triloba]
MRRAILALFAVLAFAVLTHAADPELVDDFAAPDGAKLDGTFFTYTGLRGGAPSSNSVVGRKKVSVRDLPALKGMGVSLELLAFPAGARTRETFTVGSVDSSGRTYKNVLPKGDAFVFPKGLPHYQANLDKANKAVVVSAFASSNAGTVALPKTLFSSNVPNEVLSKAFKMSADTLQEIRANQN